VTQRVLDVSKLPEGTADSRATLWWGNLAMMTIEGSMFAMLIATFLYLRVANLDWPPATVPKPDMLLPTVNFILLLLIALPAILADHSALRDDVNGARLGMGLCILAGIIILAIRFTVLANLGYKWSDHAYGSIVWTSIGFHTFHTIAATGETALLFVYSFVRPIVKKQLLDIRCVAVYWYFVILMWIPFYFLVFVQPWIQRKGM
jgi:cytochrome c oxidase subunit I+III